MRTLTVERLKEVLQYDPEKGLFFWKLAPKNHQRLQEYVAGGITTGYVVIKIDGCKYKAHRLAWLYMNSVWPGGDLDHINGCPLDNRMANLRIATNPQNQANRLRDRGKDTPKGVRKLPVTNRQILLGTFESSDEAQEAYFQASNQHYGEFARKA